MSNDLSSIRAKVYVPGKNTRPIQRPLTLEMVCEWIKLQGFDEYTTNGLIEMASRYPNQALHSFRLNFNLMIERVRAKRKKEMNAQAATPIVKEINANQDQRPIPQETPQVEGIQADCEIPGDEAGEQCTSCLNPKNPSGNQSILPTPPHRQHIDWTQYR